MTIREYVDCKDKGYEDRVFGNAFDEVVSRLPYVAPGTESKYDVWTDGDKILCRTEALQDTVANMLDWITGENEAHTGYYDPEEDERNGEVDNHTGWYYVDYD